MTAPPDPRGIAGLSPWSASVTTSAASYHVAALRAAAISLVLLVGLAVLVLL